ncbi:phosphate acetyltransferase [Micrococcales bacterium 31B]|nr:phosphate acetyltransferase [Micrococcales bacterium 31B]
MSRSIFIASSEGHTGKSTIALGVVDALSREVNRVGVFRPVTRNRDELDLVVDMLVHRPGISQDYDECIGVDYEAMHRDPVEALAEIVRRYHALQSHYDALVILGSDYTDITTPNELIANARVAANLGTPVVLVTHGHERTPAEVLTAIEVASAEMEAHHAKPVAVIANRMDPSAVTEMWQLLATREDLNPVGVVAEDPVLWAPTVRALAEAVEGEHLSGSPAWLDRESQGFVVAAMSLPHVLERLRPGATVIAPSDRGELLPALLMAHHSGTFPPLSAIFLSGGMRQPESITRLMQGVPSDLPIILSQRGTFETAQALSQVRAPMSRHSGLKMDAAQRIFAEGVHIANLMSAVDVAPSSIVTPLMFENRLLERARSANKHIVLPEGNDPRILKAAASLLRRGVARLTLLGDSNSLRQQASSLGLDITRVDIVSPHDPEYVEEFAAEYARLRAHKGMTLEKAREVVQDVSYFGTLMVHLGKADGMVSGAAHTTAHTIKPSFEIVKTRPGVTIVSSVFLMCLADRVLVYGDCAVNPDPTAEQLADIAISSAETAAQFGVEPRVAMLSYSTGTSGAGADVDKVRAATEIVKQRRPDLLVEGPIQYDAAVDPSVAASKLPGSEVAGKATVLIFPDLNTGNNTYKAVQRSAGAVAIGPVLQGLNAAVNDLSRGALVEDIVNTVAITAVQA